MNHIRFQSFILADDLTSLMKQATCFQSRNHICIPALVSHLHIKQILKMSGLSFKLKLLIYNRFHNILRLFVVLPNFSFTTSETMRDYYL